ncbi:MAG: TonB family protein [Mediterranea sp.]|jgi:TonB family protein|nr:TonB family protein [Mediterranea sp.]
MDRQKKGEYIGALGALLMSIGIVVLLVSISIAAVRPDEEAGGVPVMMGNTESAQGLDDPSLVDVDILPEDVAAPPPAEPTVPLPSEQELLTQTDEESVAIKPKEEKKKKRKETVKPKEKAQPKEITKKPEKSAAEAKRLAEEKAERERKAAAEAIQKGMASSFGKGAKMQGSSGTSASGTGIEGSPDGNASTGAKNGTGGYGTFNLGGRSLGTGGLPRPAYQVQEEGKVVVNITVNPAGVVIAVSINLQGTNTQNAALRKAAAEAARKARFNAVNGVDNQVGTITYYFKLR